MTICRWKGNIKTGGILCKKPISEVESITTDDRVTTCKECLLLTTSSKGAKHVHLNADFLSFAKTGKDGILEFEKFQVIKDKRKRTGRKDVFIVCKQDTPNWLVPEHRLTNDPKEVTCSHCFKLWQTKEKMKFILSGVMIENGLSMKKVRFTLQGASTEKMKKMLDKMIYGDKV